MTPFPWSDVAIIAVLILLNGVFALSELAIVSARGPRLQAAEKRGSRGAAVARQLAADPGRFLSTVQVRSEEHTSELQSLMRISYAVFCLKKKKNKKTTHTNRTE